jgi:hypothetical protein
MNITRGVGEGVEVLVSGDIPVRAHHVGIDGGAQFAEREPSNPLTDWTVSKAALG